MDFRVFAFYEDPYIIRTRHETRVVMELVTGRPEFCFPILLNIRQRGHSEQEDKDSGDTGKLTHQRQSN